jgi:hypothetical protein
LPRSTTSPRSLRRSQLRADALFAEEHNELALCLGLDGMIIVPLGAEAQSQALEGPRLSRLRRAPLSSIAFAAAAIVAS